MLRLFEYNAEDFTAGQLAFLDAASKVRVSEEINEERRLEFEHPPDSRITVNRLIVCEGQAYRITSITQSTGAMMNISAEHVFNCDAAKIHLPTFPNMIGKSPREVIAAAFENTSFHVMTEAETEALGMEWIGADGFKIDFFEVDKITPYDVVQTVIENAGRGEIYADNYNIAVVSKIGEQTPVLLDTSKNMENINIQRDTSQLVTRLYAYGYNDTPITSVTEDGVPYIDSPNAELYGIHEGYRDYSDYTEPTDVYNLAQWEFDESNENRIDVPKVTITGTYIDLSKISDGDIKPLNPGDSVTVYDEGTLINARVLSVERYPYEPEKTNITVGRPSADLFFYLSQLGRLGKNYKRASTSKGDIKTGYLSGTLNTETNNIKSGAGTMTVVDDLMTVRDSAGRVRIRLGNSGGRFEFVIYDENGSETITLDEEGSAEFSGRLTAEAVFSGSIKTSKDAEIGRYLKLKGITGSGQTGGIQFVDASGNVVADILLISGSNGASYFVIESSEPTRINNISIVDLEERISALEKEVGN